LAITVFSRLLFCSDRDRNTNERIHVQRPVHMSDMGQGAVGASNDAVHFSNVRSIVGSDHDGVQRR
tara:strand:- start:2631 stop:2828 length:198 start_codon:yes stop_codon:yes gene_type:complete